MQELLKISYEAENPTVSARELYDRLNIKSNFTTWFRRMCEYGFEDGKDFFPKMEESTGGRPSEEFAMKIDMAKEICMLQRSPEGKQIRQYFIDLEKAWNTPEQIFARALKMADKRLNEYKKKEQANAKASLNNYKSGLEDVNEKLKSGVATLEDYSKH